MQVLLDSSARLQGKKITDKDTGVIHTISKDGARALEMGKQGLSVSQVCAALEGNAPPGPMYATLMSFYAQLDGYHLLVSRYPWRARAHAVGTVITHPALLLDSTLQWLTLPAVRAPSRRRGSTLASLTQALLLVQGLPLLVSGMFLSGVTLAVAAVGPGGVTTASSAGNLVIESLVSMALVVVSSWIHEVGHFAAARISHVEGLYVSTRGIVVSVHHPPDSSTTVDRAISLLGPLAAGSLCLLGAVFMGHTYGEPVGMVFSYASVLTLLSMTHFASLLPFFHDGRQFWSRR